MESFALPAPGCSASLAEGLPAALRSIIPLLPESLVGGCLFTLYLVGTLTHTSCVRVPKKCEGVGYVLAGTRRTSPLRAPSPYRLDLSHTAAGAWKTRHRSPLGIPLVDDRRHSSTLVGAHRSPLPLAAIHRKYKASPVGRHPLTTTRWCKVAATK